MRLRCGFGGNLIVILKVFGGIFGDFLENCDKKGLEFQKRHGFLYTNSHDV